MLRLGIGESQKEANVGNNKQGSEGEKSSPLRTIEVLLAKGSNWKKRNNDKYTPIHLASLVGGPKALKVNAEKEREKERK